MAFLVGIDWGDVAERAIWTFVQGFLGIFILGSLSDALNPSLLDQAAVAGIMGVLSVVKNLAAQRLGQ